MNLRNLEKEQLRLAIKVEVRDNFEKLELVAGCSQAFVDDKTISAIVVLDKDFNLIEKKHAVINTTMPYVPNFLGFREAPAIVEAYSLLENEPDLILTEGNGILHPRRFGLACHVGVAINKPTIGVAKSLLCGHVEDGKIIIDKEVRGYEVVTKEHAKPVIVSPGHLVSMRTAKEIVKKLIVPPHKFPEPLHLARKYAKELRTKEMRTK